MHGGLRLLGPMAGLWALFLADVRAVAEEPAVTLAVVIDTSGSLSRADLVRSRELATGVLAALPPGSEASVFSFDDQSRLVQAHTADSGLMHQAVDGLRIAGLHTALHDALYDASRYLRDVPGSRRAILLVTDGRDEMSALSLEDGLAVATQTQIPVFCVGLGRVEERVLRRIAKLTGGEYQRGAEAEAAAIAVRILETPVHPPATAPSASAPPPVSTLAPAPPALQAPLPARPPGSPLVWAGAGLIFLAVAGGLALLFTARRRPAPSPPPAGSAGPSLKGTRQEEKAPATMFARHDVSKERLERTLLMREKAVLAVTRGARTGETFPLSGASAVSIGRARANDIVLDDAAVSSQHCRIRPEEGRFVLHDLDSTNGTLLNDRRVSKHVLSEGDVIQIGDTRLDFRMERSRS